MKTLNDVFEYKNGELFWKIKPSASVNIGDKAGCKRNALGYQVVVYKRKHYATHRVVYFMHHDLYPEYIDHIDGNPSNNKIENLRPCTLRQNSKNLKTYSNNKSGVKNVSYHKASNLWQAYISVDGKKKFLGLYGSLELAELVVIEARNKHYKEFANHG